VEEGVERLDKLGKVIIYQTKQQPLLQKLGKYIIEVLKEVLYGSQLHVICLFYMLSTLQNLWWNICAIINFLPSIER
jgi:hypothetical protein